MIFNLKQIFQKYGITVKGVLHVGAHFGQEDYSYAELGILNRIYFEPLQKNYSVLRKNIDLKFECLRTALGNSVGEIEMNVEEANEGMSSSVLQPGLHLSQYPHIKFTSKELVPMTKLDLINFDRSNFNLLNIDVQGYELEVLKGSSETLKTIDYIICEVNNDEVYIGCAKVNELDEYLGTYGFKRVETDWAGTTWGDAFYAKTSI